MRLAGAIFTVIVIALIGFMCVAAVAGGVAMVYANLR